MRVLVLGAGFGGLELCTLVSEALGSDADITLIDRTDSFMFGFSKFDVLFGKRTPEQVRLPYEAISKPGVRFLQEDILAIDPEGVRVTTDRGVHEADVMVVALGADLEPEATPGLIEHGNEFYSEIGAERLRDVLPTFTSGHAVIGVCGPSFKCPPAPSEAALLLDGWLRDAGVRESASIALVMPFGAPVPPSPDTSRSLLERFEQRGIAFVPQHRIASVEPDAVTLDDGSRLPCDLFLGIPVHRAPDVVVSSGLTEDGWIPVDKATLATRFPNVYAVGDVTSVGTPKAGVFSEGAARVVAQRLIAQARGGSAGGYDGTGTCYIEFGDDEVARVDVDFFSTPGQPTGTFTPPSPTVRDEKTSFGATRRARWFGLP
jgi:sulfide:quinone oxidoreductase